jgi:PadR family transcriptional regulator, regulatory protein PadR
MSSPSQHGEATHLKRFLQPCLLLMIAECPGHGYDLLERLNAFGFERDPGGLYRALRAMEREGLLQSEWQLSAAGPGRRRYELTPLGQQQLHCWAAEISETRKIVQTYLERYRTVVQDPGRSGEGAGDSLPAERAGSTR